MEINTNLRCWWKRATDLAGKLLITGFHAEVDTHSSLYCMNEAFPIWAKVCDLSSFLILLVFFILRWRWGKCILFYLIVPSSGCLLLMTHQCNACSPTIVAWNWVHQYPCSFLNTSHSFSFCGLTHPRTNKWSTICCKMKMYLGERYFRNKKRLNVYYLDGNDGGCIFLPLEYQY